MCHPPLVCPLCSSAGGFPSPGALWLGLIGVANRLLSCPVCHELLLGLDKLTIHLVSHVPDLNLLASTIGNFVNSNQKVIHEFGGTEPCIKRLQKSNYTFYEDVSHKNHCLPSNINSKSYEGPQKCNPTYNSDANSNVPSGVARSKKDEKELPSVKTCCGESYDLYNQSIQDGLSNKIPLFHPIAMKDTYTQTVKDLEQNSAGNVNIKVIEKTNSKINTKFSPYEGEIKFSSNQFLPYPAACQKSGSKISENLTNKEDKHIIQILCDSSSSTTTNESLNKSLKRTSVVLEPSKIYCTQATKNCLQQGSESEPTHMKNLESSKNTVENEASKCDGRTTKCQCGDCNMAFDDHRCLSLHHIMIHPNTDTLESLTCQTISSQSATNFPCQLCNRKLVSKGALLVHMRFAHSIVPGTILDGELVNQKEDPMLKPYEDINKIADVPHSLSDCEDNMISNPNLLGNHQIEINFPGELEEKSVPSSKEKKEIMDYLVEQQNYLKDNSEIVDTDNSQDNNKEECSNGSPPQQCLVDEDIKHSCKICEAQFSSIMELIAHRTAHSEDDGCICVVCGKTFKKEQHLQQHLRTHEGKQWECDVCSKFFTTKYFLKKHKRLHTGEMPYSCETCGKTFTFQQSYHKHLLYHSDEKPHACGECGKRFKELSTLHNHERIHTGEKPFTCESCGKAFRQRVSYLVHRRIHTGVMPYKCTVCEKSFRYKVSQRTHKCSSQQTGTVVRQSSDLVERLLSHQRDKPSVSECSSVGEVLFSVAAAENLSNQSQSSSQHSNGTLQELPTFSGTITIVNDKKKDSYSMVPSSLQAFPLNMPTIESQSLSNPFSISKTAFLVQEQKMPKKSAVSSSKTITCKESSTIENSTDFCSKMLKKVSENKNTESQTDKTEGTHSNASEHESSPEHFSDSAAANFLMQSDLTSENHQDSGLKGRETLCKTNEFRSNAETVGEDILNQTLFSSASHVLDSSETDFFSMVMSPAEPALEQLGKLTISSLPAPPKKVDSLFIYQDKKQYGGTDEEINSQPQPAVSPTMETQKSLGHHDESSKNGLSQVENPPSPREQESTANAADLSSFLQSCFDQWNSSNIISSEKPKVVLPLQQQSQHSVKHDHSLSDAEDNRLQTINEESLKKLLYGDSTL